MSEDYVDCSDVIIKRISQTNYTNLQTLLLRSFLIKAGGNKISSIELLQFINMPLLTELDLCKTFYKSANNSITKVSALNKCAWDSLRKISLGIDFIYAQIWTYFRKSILQGWRYSSKSTKLMLIRQALIWKTNKWHKFRCILSFTVWLIWQNWLSTIFKMNV